MPDTKNEMKMYEDLLDKLSDDYPELSEQADALSSAMMELDMEAESEAPSLPGDAEAIPPELLDDEMDEPEEEYEL